MGEREKHQAGKGEVSRRHPVRQQFMAVFLGICMMIVSIPVSPFDLTVRAAETPREILSFLELPDEVREQTIGQGLIRQEPEFPVTLEALCRVDEEEDAVSQPEMEEPSGEMDGSATESVEEATQPDVTEPSEGTDTSADVEAAATEKVVIEGITWNSEMEYDGWAEGVYVFMPVLPEGYVLAEGVELPKITVTAEGEDGISGEASETESEDPGQGRLLRNSSDIFVESAKEEMLAVPRQEPGCGTISEDTVWSGNVTLANGELVVEPGVTLTIQGVITVQGNVTIKGSGTIKRGSGNAYFKVYDGAHLTVGNVTIDGMSISSNNSMLEVIRSDIVLDEGCIVKNCNKMTLSPSGALGGGGVLNMYYGKAVFNDVLFENNYSYTGYGGAVCFRESELRVNSGVFRNNNSISTIHDWGGGCFYNIRSKLYIYGGSFIGNATRGRGGCIFNLPDKGTETYLYGGYFEGNKSSNSEYKGGGAVFHCAYDPGRPNVDAEGAVLEISGAVQFAGDEVEGSGTDGVYLDLSPDKTTARKIRISDTLRYPVTLYLKASEGYVIAEGTNEYRLLHERDMKKIHFVDVGGSGKTWYAVLDKEKNQVYLSQNKPDYGYYVYYLNNGAQGAVVDDNTYQIDDIATVQPSDGLQREGYQFVEWNTKADRTGTAYQPGEELTIEGDTDLYAIFAKGKVLKADFYSGSAGQKQTKSVELAQGEERGSVTAPELEEMEGWRALGWSEDAAGHDELIEPGTEISLTEDKEYYGVYEKDVTLRYQAEHADLAPEDAVAKCYANVHSEEVSITPAQFAVAQAAVRYGYAFAGWNDAEDLQGRTYKQGDVLETEEDATLYAIFKRPLHAYYHSGNAGQVEEQVVEIPEDATSGTTRTQELKPFGMAGSAKSAQDAGNAKNSQDAAKSWQPVGWDLQKDGYDGEIQAGEEVTLMDDTDYYGIYEKDVTLSYDANGGEDCPQGETKECRANVHEEVSYDVPEFTLAAATAQSGYAFAGWNTKKDGTGESFEAGKAYALDEDTVLYAQWEVETASYRVEHYRQDLEGDGYTRVDADTETIAARAGTEVTAEANPYVGFTVNTSSASGKMQGIVAADSSLVLRVYYDRNVYEIKFDLNGGEGAVPEPQTMRYGGLLREPQEPQRRGYTFKGWYRDANGSEESYWDFGKTVEGNTSTLKTTLYAKWVDEIAPVLGEASFGTEYKNFMDWVVSRRKLVVSVPVTEEGSGLKQADYRLEPENGEAREGVAAIRAGQIPTREVNARSGGIAAVMTLYGDAHSGQGVAEITVDGDFKGSIILTCMDNACNISVQKTLTADGAGAVVEDNAPEISFTKIRRDNAKGKAKVSIDVTDTAGENITAGIASVSYQIDGGKAKSKGKEEFVDNMVENYSFDVALKGEGEHTLKVAAEDNAGNRSIRETTIQITKKKAAVVQKEQPPKATEPPKPTSEPKTGENGFVKIFATVGMIAGFTYLLLYFCSGESGVTEKEKEEIISRLVRWAQKGKLRKYPALLVISLFLIYYHSIGKSVDDGWKKAYEG